MLFVWSAEGSAGGGVGVISTVSGAFVRCPGHGHKDCFGFDIRTLWVVL